MDLHCSMVNIDGLFVDRMSINKIVMEFRCACGCNTMILPFCIAGVVTSTAFEFINLYPFLLT